MYLNEFRVSAPINPLTAIRITRKPTIQAETPRYSGRVTSSPMNPLTLADLANIRRMEY
jgi:hypothetical protein